MRNGILAVLAIGFFALGAGAQEGGPFFTLTRRGAPEVSGNAAQSEPSSLTVPAETEVAVQMLSGVHTQISRVNDPIVARLLQPVYVNGRVALPSGSLLNGRITLVRPTGHLHRPAELGLRFERITLPDGQADSIAAVLAAIDDAKKLHLHLDAEGHLIGSRGLSVKALLGGFVGLGALGTVRAALVSPTAVSALLPLGGAAVAGFEILFPRGSDINLPPETHCRVRLNYPLTVRVAW
jgi:hypothetical protein